MRKTMIAVFCCAIALLFAAGAAWADDQERSREMLQTQEQQQIYGSQLMSQQEQAEYRAKLRNSKTAEEQEQIRREHHERIKERAKTLGVNMPDEPPIRGGGMGPGGGRGLGGRRP